jgi:dolichyl-diphosphooligosaccharide--protein glycosyltransferase
MVRSGPPLTKLRRPSLETSLALIIAAGALVFRIAGPYRQVFRDGWINFQGDAWYHLRAIEHLVRNFPHRLTADPYAGPDAPYVFIAPLFDYLVAITALVAGLGSPSGALVERIAAVVPAILGSAAILLAYVLGRSLFDARAGLLGATLLAILPGPFLDRTRLGAADHHALEVLLVLAVIALVARANGRAGTAVLAGAALGAYFLTWTSAPLFAAALGVWAIAQFVLNRARGLSSTPLASLLASMAAIALACVLLLQNPAMFRYRLQITALTALLALAAAIGLADRLRVRTWMLLAACGVLAAAGAAAVGFGLWHPPIEWLQDLARFSPKEIGRTVAEVQPLFSSSGSFSLLSPWNVFQAAFPLGLLGLIALCVRIFRRDDAGGAALVAVWTLFALAATLGQVRFAYYLAPMLAILSGFVCSSVLSWMRARGTWRFDLTIVLLAAAVFYPSLRVSVAAVRADEGMPARWKRTLDWMRAATPEPFGDPGAYFRRYDPNHLPRAEYTVMSWWDHGYWILRGGRRVPVAIPTQDGAADAARFFTATSEADARALLDRLRSRFVVVDDTLAFERTADRSAVQGKFEALALWAGRPLADFVETMWSRGADGRRVPVVVFHPDYYRSMAVRLSRFGTDAVVPDNSTWVVSYADVTRSEGVSEREITNAVRFARYEEAESYRRTLGGNRHLIAGLDPARTCVPLPATYIFEMAREESDAGARVQIFRVH